MVQPVVGATDIVGLDVRLRVDASEPDLDAVSVRVDPWVQLCVDVWVADFFFWCYGKRRARSRGLS